MKVRTEVRFGVITMAILCALAVGFSAQAAPVADLLKFLPPDAHAAVGLPNIAEVEKVAAPLLALPELAEVSSLAVNLGGDTFAEGLANSGINATAQAVAFVKVNTPEDIAFGGVLVVQDAAKVTETLTGLLGGEGAEITLPGDIKGKFVASSNVGYFIAQDKLFIGSTEVMLQQLAGRILEPATINYGKEGAKEEVVAFTRIDVLEQSGLMAAAGPLSQVKPLIDTLKPFSDELILAIGRDGEKAYIRAAAHDLSNAPVASPGPLNLHGFMDPKAPVLMNLRLTPELINTLSMILVLNPSTRQVGGYTRIAAGLLGDEVALSFKGMKGDKIPDAVIATKVKQAATVPNLLKMVAKIEAPSYQLEGNDVYVYPNVEGTDLHIAVAGETLVVTPGEESLKSAVEGFSNAAAGSGVDANIVAKGVYGFLSIDGAKAKEVIPADLVPANLDLAQINLALTLGVDGEWREITLASPTGFDGIANTLKDVM